MADVFDEYESISQFQQKVRAKSKELEIYKNELFDKKQIPKPKKKLVSLKTELSDQNKILNLNKKEKNSLLTTTKTKKQNIKNISRKTSRKRKVREGTLSI